MSKTKKVSHELFSKLVNEAKKMYMSDESRPTIEFCINETIDNNAKYLLKLNLSEDELGELAFQMAYALTH
jgi:hypothetical protein